MKVLYNIELTKVSFATYNSKCNEKSLYDLQKVIRAIAETPHLAKLLFCW